MSGTCWTLPDWPPRRWQASHAKPSMRMKISAWHWLIQSDELEEIIDVDEADGAITVGQFFTVEVLSVGEATVDPPGSLHGD